MNHYECLKVTPDAPTEVIRAAYRALAGKRHPDRQGSPTGAGRDDEVHMQMVAINAAYEVLINPELRTEYDAMLAAKAKAKAKPKSAGRLAVGKSTEAPDAERSNGFSETRVDVDWMMSKPVVLTPLWPLTGTRKHLAIAAGGALLLFVISAAWDVISRHKMDKALSQQYAAHTNAAAPEIDAIEPTEPPSGLTVPKPIEPVPNAADTDVPLTPEEVLAKQQAASAASRPEVPPPSFDRQPTVTELSRLSDEQLMAILPSLGELQPAKGSFSRQVNRGVGHHPLDGKPLNLRTDKQLIDPLAPESLRH